MVYYAVSKHEYEIPCLLTGSLWTSTSTFYVRVCARVFLVPGTSSASYKHIYNLFSFVGVKQVSFPSAAAEEEEEAGEEEEREEREKDGKT